MPLTQRRIDNLAGHHDDIDVWNGHSVIICVSSSRLLGLILHNLLLSALLKFEKVRLPKKFNAKSFQLMYLNIPFVLYTSSL